jgi:hypothetical protein
LVRTREKGVTQEELVETVTHLAFYAGWPNVVTAIGVAREVFEKGGKRRWLRPFIGAGCLLRPLVTIEVTSKLY